ncbi:MAG: CHASE3 domain-containing protein, partial [Burkholderiaceae bacterium]
AANEVSHQRANSIIDSGQHALAGRVEISRLLRVMLSAESGQRGYLMTGRMEYREPYKRAVADVGPSLDRIHAVYASVPEQAVEIRQLDELTRQKLSELETTLVLYDAGKEEAWRELLLTNIGREKMRALENLALSIAAKETVQMTEANEALSRTLIRHRLGIAVLVLLALSALLLYLQQTGRGLLMADEQRQALQSEVARRTHDLTDIARHLQTAREDERSRLARELHDELGGLLTAAKLDVARMRSRLTEAPLPVHERIAHLVRTLDEGIALKRRIIENLRPSALQNLGLKAALEILTREFASGAAIEMDAHIDEVTLGPDANLSLYRLVQEALTNVSKYAGATRVVVQLAREGDGVRAKVEDNGKGFDTRLLRPETHGLAGMRFRIESHGGQLDVRSAPDEGTTISAWLPIESAQEASVKIAA